MHHYCITFDIHFSLCKVHLFQCTGRHLRLIDMCGLFMLKIIIFKKFSGWGLYSGALNSPEITVITLSYNYECFVLRIADTTKMYHSQKSARQSMFDCGVCNKWLEKVFGKLKKVNELFLVGWIGSAHTRTHHDGIMDLGDRKELSPYANPTM